MTSAVINWDSYRRQMFVLALTKFLARFPKKRLAGVTKRPKPLYKFVP